MTNYPTEEDFNSSKQIVKWRATNGLFQKGSPHEPEGYETREKLLGIFLGFGIQYESDNKKNSDGSYPEDTVWSEKLFVDIDTPHSIMRFRIDTFRFMYAWSLAYRLNQIPRGEPICLEVRESDKPHSNNTKSTFVLVYTKVNGVTTLIKAKHPEKSVTWIRSDVRRIVIESSSSVTPDTGSQLPPGCTFKNYYNVDVPIEAVDAQSEYPPFIEQESVVQEEVNGDSIADYDPFQDE